MYKQKWDLDVFFPGGSDSPQFQQFLENIKKDLEKLRALLEDKVPSEESVLLMQSILRNAQEAGSFVHCLSAQDVNDQKAAILAGDVFGIQAQYDTLATAFSQKLAQMDDKAFDAFLKPAHLAEIAFPLREMRRLALDKMPLANESLANDLAIDGYHGWQEIYATLIGKTVIPFEEEDGRVVELSISQIDNKYDSPDRNVRQRAFRSVQAAWKRQEDAFAQVINHLSGFRLNLYKQRGWQNILKEPLDCNRMSQKTLDAMWAAIMPYKPLFTKFLKKKAQLLGLDKLSFYDLEAPLATSKRTFSYDEGAEIIIKEFRKVSPHMSDFAKKALKDGWIEAEDRPGKRPGGFCTDFPKSKQTRIFMTYSDTVGNLSTLTHELGHAYHSYVIENLAVFNQGYRMNVAETASTFAEQVVFDSLLADAEGEERLALLDNKISRTVAFLMNIYARFLFETRFYAAREKGALSPNQLCELMVQAQKEAYDDALDEWNPYFWLAKGHFYITGVPFYNFPYTFGYLLSVGVYAHRHDPNFGEKYKALLEDTGRMTSEDLVKKHLGANIEETAFWNEALEILANEYHEFEKLTR